MSDLNVYLARIFGDYNVVIISIFAVIELCTEILVISNLY